MERQSLLCARFYNPIIARFTQEDEYRGDGLNLYAYVGNNPIKFVDIVARIAVVVVRRTGLNLILSILATHLDQLTIQQEGMIGDIYQGRVMEMLPTD